MKKKIGISAAVICVLVIAVVGFVLLFAKGKDSYRSILVQQTNGTTEVTRTEEVLDTYDGMKLQSGDKVQVFAESNLVLKLDQDKYVYAEENTNFYLKATGTEKAGKTVLCLENGSTLIEIQKKLAEEESFEVETPNTVMAVRGTVFDAAVSMDEQGEVVTILSVFQGEVACEAAGETRSILPGNQLVITGNANPVVTEQEIQLEDISTKVLEQLTKIDNVIYSDEELKAALNADAMKEEPTSTPTVTSTPVPTATSTPVPTATSTPVPTATSTPVPTATSTPTPVPASESGSEGESSPEVWYIDNGIEFEIESNVNTDDFMLGRLGREGTYKYTKTYDNGRVDSGTYEAGIYVMDNHDGTVTYTMYMYSFDVFPRVTVVDKYTGTEFSKYGWYMEPVVSSDPMVTLADGMEVKFAIEKWEMSMPEDIGYASEWHMAVTVPAEYDGVLFKVNADDPAYFYKEAPAEIVIITPSPDAAELVTEEEKTFGKIKSVSCTVGEPILDIRGNVAGHVIDVSYYLIEGKIEMGVKAIYFYDSDGAYIGGKGYNADDPMQTSLTGNVSFTFDSMNNDVYTYEFIARSGRKQTGTFTVSDIHDYNNDIEKYDPTQAVITLSELPESAKPGETVTLTITTDIPCIVKFGGKVLNNGEYGTSFEVNLTGNCIASYSAVTKSGVLTEGKIKVDIYK